LVLSVQLVYQPCFIKTALSIVTEERIQVVADRRQDCSQGDKNVFNLKTAMTKK
jgi:hypothetical protein